MSFSVREKVEWKTTCICVLQKKNDSNVAAQRSFRLDFNRKHHDSMVPTAKVIKIWITNLVEMVLALKKKPVRKKKKTICTSEDVVAVSDALIMSPRRSCVIVEFIRSKLMSDFARRSKIEHK